MKSSKSSRQPYASSERKNGKRSEKAAKLDRKSSRGMIYENEELRLRTININAEVERGQSDIKRLRRENEQLRREIWTLRDECDRLNKRFKARLVDHDACNARGSGGSGGCSGRRGSCSRSRSNSHSEDSDSCDTCREDHDDDPSPEDCKYSPNECCQDGSCRPYDQVLEEAAQRLAQSQAGHSGPGAPAAGESQPLHSTFDHLSVVSEETLSNSEVAAAPPALQPDSLLGYTPDISGSQTTLPSLVGPLTPLTPIELVANQLNDLQAVVPPLSYFENVVQQQHMSSIGSHPDSAQTTGSGSGQTVIQTNGWDYNLQSPFTQRKYPSATRAPSASGRYPAPPLTTFGPNNTLAPPTIVRSDAGRLPGPGAPAVETVAITTVAPGNSPKHFFAPLKPRLKLNTTLANRNLVAAAVPLPPAPAPAAPSNTPPHGEPPDIFVANALASPYHRPVPTTSANGACPAPPPPLPQRQTPQVSPHQRRRQRHAHHQHHRPSTAEPGSLVATATIVVSPAPAFAGPDDPRAQLLLTPTSTPKSTAMPATAPASLSTLNPLFTKHADPIYATAQRLGGRFISAPAVTQTLMATTVVRSQPASACGSASPPTTTTERKQTDSANLEAILNDIETISEDILAIQLEKSRSRENLEANRMAASGTATASAHVPRKLQQEDKNKKPYRSEMNLLLSYDGANPTITPTAPSSTATETSAATGTNGIPVSGPPAEGGTLRRARSLEREHTDSPSPHVPDPMAPFPPDRTYIGFDKLNVSVGTAKPPLPPSQIVAQVPPNGVDANGAGLSNKAMPPTPPARTLPQPQKPLNTDQTATSESSLAGLAPNKSHLFAAIAGAAAAKRSQFRAAPPHLTRSLDTDGTSVDPGDQESQAAEAAKRKARRVSIVCGDSSKEGEATAPQRPPTALGSCSDLQAPNPTIMNLRQSSYSTPSSPHSGRRGSNGLLEVPGGGAHHPSHLPAAFMHHQHSNSAPAPRKDSPRGSSATAAEVAAARSKCSRRHSDGTVVPGAQRVSGASSGHHHHHNHNHHHQTSSLLGHNPHHSHHSHQDSNHETGTSISDRNSVSLSSSRESSASFSLRSHRRKISVSSHTGGKIPWCGCWGNGCL